MQHPSKHRMLQDDVQQHIRTLVRAFRLRADAQHLEGRGAAQRRKRELQCIALRPCWCLIDEAQPALGERQAFVRPQVPERRLGGLGVMAQRGQRLAAAFEVRSEFRRGYSNARVTLTLECSTDLAVQLRPVPRRRALVQHVSEQRVPERVGRVRGIRAVLIMRRAQPQLLARKFIASLADGRRIAPQRVRERGDTELRPANGRRRQQRSLLATEPGNVVVDDGRETLRHRGAGDLGRGRRVSIALCSACRDVAHDGCHEQRDAVGPRVQGPYERLVTGERWVSFGDVLGDLAFGKRIEHDLLAQPVQA